MPFSREQHYALLYLRRAVWKHRKLQNKQVGHLRPAGAARQGHSQRQRNPYEDAIIAVIDFERCWSQLPAQQQAILREHYIDECPVVHMAGHASARTKRRALDAALSALAAIMDAKGLL